MCSRLAYLLLLLLLCIIQYVKTYLLACWFLEIHKRVKYMFIIDLEFTWILKFCPVDIILEKVEK